MARVYHPTKDGKALQNKKKGSSKEAKGGGPAPEGTQEKKEGEGE